MKYSLEVVSKAKKIKLVAFDIDGVMTDGSLIYLPDGTQAKAFNAKDGLGIVMLNVAGFKTAIITAKETKVVMERAKTLNITKVFMNQKNKILALKELSEEFSLNYDEIMYMGDDLPDIEVLKTCGLSVCPFDAVDEVKEICDIVTEKSGGRGAVREICDFLLKARGVTFEDLRKPSQQ